MTEFVPGDLGYTPIYMLGGPLDGRAYGDIPLFPNGLPGSSIAIPLGQPHAPKAHYQRSDERTPDGGWVYTYTGTDPEPVPATAAGPQQAHDDGGDGEDRPMTHVPDIASRFMLEQAWWIASELCRRHSRLAVIVASHLGGHYSGPQVIDPHRPAAPSVFFNQHGRIRFFAIEPEPRLITWHEVFAMDGPHDLLKEIETTLGLGTGSADATTRRSIGYRAISALITRTLNDRVPWGVDDSIQDMLTHIRPSPELKLFPTVTVPTAQDPEKLGAQLRQIFLVKRDNKPVVVIDNHPRAHTRDGDYLDLMAIYKRRHRLDDVTNELIERIAL